MASLCIDFTALFQGVLRINQRSYEDAFVDDPVCDVHVVVQSCNSFRGVVQDKKVCVYTDTERRRGLLCEWHVEEEQSV